MSEFNLTANADTGIAGFGAIPDAPKGSPANKKTAGKPKTAKKETKKAAPAPKAKAKAKAKANTAPKRAAMPDGRSVHADLPAREPKWNDRRKAVVLAMRELGATGVTTAVTAAEIAAKAAKKGAPELKEDKGVFFTKIILDVYRTNELLHNGFAASCRLDGERELRYYLTAKGQSTKFPSKKPAAADKE